MDYHRKATELSAEKYVGMIEEQREVENTMSASMLDFVHTYGIQVKKA